MTSPGNRHCANCIGALSFPIARTASARRRYFILLMGDFEGFCPKERHCMHLRAKFNSR